MEAGARPAEQDKNFNDPRFQFVAAVDMPRYVYTIPFTSMAWLYGPIAAGAFGVLITFIIIYVFVWLLIFIRSVGERSKGV